MGEVYDSIIIHLGRARQWNFFFTDYSAERF